MIKNYQCSKCKKNLFSQQDLNLHSAYCKVPASQYLSQVYGTNSNTNNAIDYLNNYNINSSANNDITYLNNNDINTYINPTITETNNNNITYSYPTTGTNINNIIYTNQDINTNEITYETPIISTNGNDITYENPNIEINSNDITYTDPTIITNTNNISYTNPTLNTDTKTNTNIILPQKKQPATQAQTQKTYFRPQTITYFDPNLNQINDYSQLYQNQNEVNSIQTTNNNNNISGSTYKCNICGKDIPLNEQKDHLLSHKLDQEEKDRLQAQSLQDDDLFENVPPEKIEEQRKIEEHIRRQRERQNNNNNINNNIINNDFNINDDMGMNNFGGMNMRGIPNVIIRRTTTTNNGIPNNITEGMGSPNFFENFFNGNMNNMNMGPDIFNMPSGHMRRIIIPMGGMGNMGGIGNQNDLNELIERMLHYSRDNPTDAAIVSELPENEIDDINKLDNDKKNCVICMEDFKNGDKSTNLPCLHMFHTNCIQSWLKKQNTCPICKFKLTQDNINNINRRG